MKLLNTNLARVFGHGLLLGGPLHLVAVVLEPDLHLCGGEVDEARQLLDLGGAQVLLLLEPPLQLVHLGTQGHDGVKTLSNGIG